MIEIDASKVRQGLMSTGRNQEELNKTGEIKIVMRMTNSTLTHYLALACVEPVCGKAERMKTHLKQGKNISGDERTLALLNATKAAPRLPSQILTAPSTPQARPISSTVPSTSVHVQTLNT
jgi:hypothetical protein